jgi:glycosyltransferase involved in cell wall biosynthesis
MNTLEASGRDRPRLSVVIPCFNEERYVTGLLSDLEGQTVRPESVMVADCNSEDHTRQVVEAFADKLPLGIVASPARSPAAARNSAVEALTISSEDFLVFIDADMRLPKDFLELTGELIRQHDADFMTPTFLSDGESIVDTVLVKRINTYNRRMIRRSKAAGIGGLMIVRKAAHDASGGFPGDIIKDDQGYLERLNAHGVTAYYAANLYAINSSRRVRQDGLLKLLLGFLPEASPSARVASRLTRRNVHGRTYGHYRQELK